MNWLKRWRGEKMGKPKIRFKGYTEDWEQRKLGEIITEYKETVDSDCTLPILTSSKTEGVILQEEHFGRKQQHDITGYNILPRNYCTYRNRSDGVDFTFNINKCCDKGIISKFYPVFSGKNSDVFFLSLVLNNSDEVVREIAYTCTGTGQKVLSFLDLQKMKVRVPSFYEQKEIATYFDVIDHLITLHQRKCDETKKLKKCMLQKMFPKDEEKAPEIRFSGFTGDWKQRKLGEVFKEYSEKNHAEQPALTIMQGQGTIKREDAERNLLYNKSNLSSYKMVYQDDFIVHLRSFEGGLEKASCNGIVSPAYHIFHGEKADSRFYYSYFRSYEFIKRKLVPHIYGIRDGRSIDIVGMKTIDIPYPSFEEQQRIGDYLDSINNLITFHQQKCDELKNIKKFMLQNMFVQEK